MQLFFLSNARNASLNVAFPQDSVNVVSKSDGQGFVNIDANITPSLPSETIPASVFQHKTDHFMCNSLLSILISIIKNGKLNQSLKQIQQERILELFGGEFLDKNISLWNDHIEAITGKSDFKELQHKILRTSANGYVTVTKGLSSPVKPTSVFMNFIDHEIEHEIIPAIYKHNTNNGGKAIMRFSSFTDGPFCQIIFTPEHWTTIIGEEQGNKVTVTSVHHHTREKLEKRIQLADMGFMQHITTSWINAIMNGVEQPHQNIEVILFDAKNGNDTAVANRLKFIVQKLKMLFDESDPADTDRIWVTLMRDVLMGMGTNTSEQRSHIVTGRIIHGH